MIRYEIGQLAANTPLKAKAAVFASAKDAPVYQRMFERGESDIEGYIYNTGQMWSFPVWTITPIEEPDTNEWGDIAP